MSRPGGQVAWQLGGKRSSFGMGPGTTFWFQHHITPLNASTVGIFDDGGAPPQEEKQSRGILLDLDTRSMRATLKQAYTHPAGLAAANQGSMQVLADGRVLVGWGNLPYFSEFAADGMLLLDGQFPVGDQSYRVNPAGGSVVYASWNGATEVATWTVLAGTTASALARAGSQPFGLRDDHGEHGGTVLRRDGPGRRRPYARPVRPRRGGEIGRTSSLLPRPR